MPVRLLRAYNGQAANTMYWGNDEASMRSIGVADDQLEMATDYQQATREVTSATVIINNRALVYNMNSASAQTATMPRTGFWLPGTVVTVVQLGTGAFTIVASSGVTINTAYTSLVSKGQYNIAQLVKVGTNSWVAAGGLGG